MSTSTLTCGVCELRHITKSSIVWCTECDEGLCTECREHHSLSKSSRDHTVIPISNYQKLAPHVLKISQYCDKHNEKFQIYCKIHESPCCSNCVVESHKECRDFVRLSEVILNVKTSNAFSVIENTVAEVSENIKNIRENRHETLRKISEKRKQIEQEIENTRITINTHLDKLQGEIRKELCEAEERENKEMSQFITLLEVKENEIAEFQRKISSIKQHASDMQAFLAMKQLEQDLIMKEEFLQSLIDNDIIKQHTLIYRVSEGIRSFVSNIQNFGEIILETKQTEVVLTRNKRNQAQMLVRNVEPKSIVDINLKLHKTVIGTGKKVFGCCGLPDGKMAFTNKDEGIRILENDGLLCCDIETSHYTFDVEYIDFDDTLAVTDGNPGRHSLSIINMKDTHVNKEIRLNTYAFGIARNDVELIYSGSRSGIRKLNLKDKFLHDIVQEKMPAYCYVATTDKNIYHTNTSTVTCYDLQGNTQWIFKNTTVLMYPVGIALDKDGNVYVVGNQSNNVVVISADGQHHRQLLSSEDGLSNPWCLHYNRSTNQLLVSNFQDKAFMYSLI